MQILEADVQNAILEIFALNDLGCGEAIESSTLDHYWTKTDLRRSDLITGLAKLCSRALLDIQDRAGIAIFSLTQNGVVQARDVLAAGVGYCDQYFRVQVLPAIRKPPHSPSPTKQLLGNGRRAYEIELSDGVPQSN